MEPDVQVVVIGAGQAGLAAAHGLVRGGLAPGQDLLVLDSNDGPGGAWRHRWDSLTFDRAHGLADLPGLRLGRPDPTVPASQVVSDYYGRYEEMLGLQVVRPATVTAVTADDGAEGPLTVAWQRNGAGHSVRAAVVVSATGTWTRPFVPYVPGIATFRGEQVHTAGFTDAQHFAGRRTVVVGGGLSAVQFLLQLAPVTETVWATRRPPNFTCRQFNLEWGRDVEVAVRARTEAGLASVSVVRTTGIPLWPDYLRAVDEGILVSRGMFNRITPGGVIFDGEPMDAQTAADGFGPSAADRLVLPKSWRPFEEPTVVDAEVIFWNTGFRAALDHLNRLHLRGSGGGIVMRDEVEVVADHRVLLVGYGSSASTIGATRAGRKAASVALTRLGRTVPRATTRQG